MRNSDKQELKKKYKRIGLFLLIVLIPCLFFTAILSFFIAQWLNILLTVLLLFVLFVVFNLLCEKLDQRKKVRMQQKKDPFSE